MSLTYLQHDSLVLCSQNAHPPTLQAQNSMMIWQIVDMPYSVKKIIFTWTLTSSHPRDFYEKLYVKFHILGFKILKIMHCFWIYNWLPSKKRRGKIQNGNQFKFLFKALNCYISFQQAACNIILRFEIFYLPKFLYFTSC